MCIGFTITPFEFMLFHFYYLNFFTNAAIYLILGTNGNCV